MPSAEPSGPLTIVSKLNIRPGVTCASVVGRDSFFPNIRYALNKSFKSNTLKNNPNREKPTT